MKKKRVVVPTKEQLEADAQVRFESHLNCYKYQTGLKFKSRALNNALKIMWNEFYDMPRAHAGSKVIIVPTCAVNELRKRGLKFEQQVVVRHGEGAEEVARLKAAFYGHSK